MHCVCAQHGVVRTGCRCGVLCVACLVAQCLLANSSCVFFLGGWVFLLPVCFLSAGGCSCFLCVSCWWRSASWQSMQRAQ
jgi:hypothetical protein